MRPYAALLLLLLVSCRPAGRSERGTIASDSIGRDSIQAPASPDWTVSSSGAGALRIGMTYAELSPFLTNPADTTRYGDGCGYASVKDAPPGLMFMVEQRKLARIEVRSGKTATAEGARLGDSEADVLRLYPEARRTPHKYVNGSYFIVLPRMPADSLHRYVFETDGHHVTTIHAGIYPAVEYVEGCS